MQEINLKGNNYQGKFLGEQQSEKFRYVGSSNERMNFWWSGQGLISVADGTEERFLFNTVKLHTNLRGLEQELIGFDSIYVSYPSRPEILDYSSIVDLALKKMYEKSVEQRKEGKIIIPKIAPSRLSIEFLVEQGLVRKVA